MLVGLRFVRCLDLTQIFRMKLSIYLLADLAEGEGVVDADVSVVEHAEDFTNPPLILDLIQYRVPSLSFQL